MSLQCQDCAEFANMGLARGMEVNKTGSIASTRTVRPTYFDTIVVLMLIESCYNMICACAVCVLCVCAVCVYVCMCVCVGGRFVLSEWPNGTYSHDASILDDIACLQVHWPCCCVHVLFCAKAPGMLIVYTQLCELYL